MSPKFASAWTRDQKCPGQSALRGPVAAARHGRVFSKRPAGPRPGGSIPSRSTAPMSNTARRFNCASCRRQVVLCRRCDRGHVYCSRECGETARRKSLRLAGRRYQNSRRGRHTHAQRQRRYRERQRRPAPENRTLVQKVTHHPLTHGPRRPVVRKARNGLRGTRSSGRESPTGILRCHGCGRFCGRVVRM